MKNRKTQYLACIFAIMLLYLSASDAFAQNIAITDDNGYAADSSAILDIKSTTKGMLVPRLTTLQRTGIADPAAGLLVFDSDEGGFFYYNGTAWINLTSGNPDNLFGKTGSRVFLNNVNDNLGIGTQMPYGKMEVKGDAAGGPDDPIFSVVNNTGDTLFAVYPAGVRIYVSEDSTKAGSKGGFAVGGFSSSKGPTNEYLRITPDSVRIYIAEQDPVKSGAGRGGFAVGGFSSSKGLTNEYLRVTEDSVRIYVDEDSITKTPGIRGGFAVGGFSASKTTTNDLLHVSPDSVRIYIARNGPAIKTPGNAGGFKVMEQGPNNYGIPPCPPLIACDYDLESVIIKGDALVNIASRTLFVNGSSGGAGGWFTDSDERLKKNITTIPDALSRVQQLRGVNFEWNETKNHAKGLKMGFLAQEALGVIPEVVDNGSGYYSMEYASITALLVEAIKEQQKLIEALQKKVEELENK
ncbi:MAG: tail fiber domain-containing protein [Bacteroidetes bacterium]|nr:tail fiber domain-containing protein [Bacteroidota bacterium]